MAILGNFGGRILFAVPFVVFGIMHFVNAAMMAGMVPSYMPGGGEIWLYITGVAMILAGISIVINVATTLSCLLLSLLLILYIVLLWVPGMMHADSQISGRAMVSLFKDIGLLGGALMVIGLNQKKATA